MLLYIKSKDSIDKSQVIQTLEIRFTFLDRQKKLVFFMQIGYAIDNITENTIYITLKINIRVRKNFVVRTNMLWLQRLSLIINKISIINLKLFISMNKQLQKAKRLDISSNSIFKELFLVVLIGDFYQFTFISRKSFMK